jgi:hypothetical protein
MPLERLLDADLRQLLLTSCLLPDTTRFKENKTYVEITPRDDETILFFCIDNKSRGNARCAGCNLGAYLWNNQEGQRICDLLVFYARENRRVLCFVELKDNRSDLGDATDQVCILLRLSREMA